MTFGPLLTDTDRRRTNRTLWRPSTIVRCLQRMESRSAGLSDSQSCPVDTTSTMTDRAMKWLCRRDKVHTHAYRMWRRTNQLHTTYNWSVQMSWWPCRVDIDYMISLVVDQSSSPPSSCRTKTRQVGLLQYPPRKTNMQCCRYMTCMYLPHTEHR